LRSAKASVESGSGYRADRDRAYTWEQHRAHGISGESGHSCEVGVVSTVPRRGEEGSSRLCGSGQVRPAVSAIEQVLPSAEILREEVVILRRDDSFVTALFFIHDLDKIVILD